MAFGSLAGYDIDDGGIMPSVTFTMGDRTKNLSIKGGYFLLHEKFPEIIFNPNTGFWEDGEEVLNFYQQGFITVSGMIQLTERTTFVRELVLAAGDIGFIGIGGAVLRFGRSPRRQWQLGGSLWIADGGPIPIPFPHISYTYVFSKRNTSNKKL